MIDSFVFGGMDKCTAAWKDNLDQILKNVSELFNGRRTKNSKFQVVDPRTQLVNAYPLLRFCPLFNAPFKRYVEAGKAIDA